MNNRVIKNASWIIICKIAESFISLIIGMITARYLGPANYGLINYAASIVAFVTPIMHLGITNILVQEFVQHKESEGEILGTTILMCMCSAFLCMLGVVSFTIVANPEETETIIVCGLYSTLLIFQSLECIKYWFQAQLKAKYSSISTLLAYAVVAIYKVFLLVNHKSVYWFAITASLDYLLFAIILLALYKRHSGQKFTVSINTAKRLVGKGKYYIVSSMMVTIFAQTDKIMLKTMINSEVTGYYASAVTCAGLTGFVFLAIIDSFRPIIFESQKKSEESFNDSIIKLYFIIIYLSLMQSIFMTIFASFIIKTLYGSAYIRAIPCLQIIVWYTTFSYLGAVRNIWILAENKQRYLWIINLCGALANILLNAILIPLLAEQGAAIASLITQFFTNVIIGYILRPIRENNRLMIKGLDIRNIRNTKSIIKIKR